MFIKKIQIKRENEILLYNSYTKILHRHIVFQRSHHVCGEFDVIDSVLRIIIHILEKV